jgi:hypothetical protein
VNDHAMCSGYDTQPQCETCWRLVRATTEPGPWQAYILPLPSDPCPEYVNVEEK